MEQSSNPDSKLVFFPLKALGSAPQRDHIPSRRSAEGRGMGKGLGTTTCALLGLVPRRPNPTSSSFRAYLSVTSSRESSLTPCHPAPHPVSWAFTPTEPGHCGSCLWGQDLPVVAFQSPAFPGSLPSVWVKDMQETVLESSGFFLSRSGGSREVQEPARPIPHHLPSLLGFL